MKTKNIVTTVLGAVMLIALALQYRNDALGLAFHEIAGAVLVVLIIVHLVLNLRRWTSLSQLGHVVSVLLLICVAMLAASGVYVARVGGPAAATWLTVHRCCAGVSVILIGVHIGLNWGFITHTFAGVKKIPTVARRVIAVVLVVVIVGFGAYSAVTSEFGSLLASPFSNGQRAVAGGRGFPGGVRPSGALTPGGSYTPGGSNTPGARNPGGVRPSGAPTPGGSYTPGGRSGGQRNFPSGRGPRGVAPATTGNPATGTLAYLSMFGLFAIIVRGIRWLVHRPETQSEIDEENDPGDGSSGPSATGTVPMA